MSELAATARSGAACASACRIASVTAATVTSRPPQAAGGSGFTNVPGGRCTWSGRKHPSFIGIVGSTKQRHRVHDARQRLRDRRVDRAARLRRRPAEIDVDRAVPAQRDRDAHHVEGARLDAVAVDRERALVPSWRQLRRATSRIRRSDVAQVASIDHRRHLGRAEPVVQLLDAAGDHVHAGDERLHVAHDLVGRAAVATDDAHARRSTGSPSRSRRTGGSSRPSTKVSVASDANPAAEIPPTSATWMSVPGEERDAAVREHRTEDEDVVGVDAAAVGVVQREHVAGRASCRAGSPRAAPAASTAGWRRA